MDPPAWSASPSDDEPVDEQPTRDYLDYESERLLAEPLSGPRYIPWSSPAPEDLGDPETYVPLTPALSAAIDLHGSKARRRHVGQAMMRALGYVPNNETSMQTLLVFAWLSVELDVLLAKQVVPIDARARALASEGVRVGQHDMLDADLGQPGHAHRSSRNWRRVDIGNDLFVHVRRFLRSLVESGALIDQDDA